MTLATRQAQPLKLRRHRDPPGLWMSVFVGSLLLNGLVLVSLQRYMHQLKPSPVAFAPISIDFVPADIQQNLELATKSTIAPVNSSAKVVSTPSQNPITTPSNSNSTSLKAGEISMPAAAQSPRSTPIGSPPSSVKPQAPDLSKPSTSAPVDSKAPSSKTMSNQLDADSTGTPSSMTNESLPPQSTDEVATSGILLPGFTQPPDPRANPGNAQSTPIDALPLSSRASVSTFLMQVKVLPVASDRSTETAPNSDLSQQSKTVLSGESGCFVTPEALHYFNQPVTYTLTLDSQGHVVHAAPVSPTSEAWKSYQDLASCSLKTWTFDSLSRSSAPAQVEPNQLVVQVVLQKQ